jgi:hypothetical protein
VKGTGDLPATTQFAVRYQATVNGTLLSGYGPRWKYKPQEVGRQLLQCCFLVLKSTLRIYTPTLEVLKAVRSRKFLDNSNVIPAAFKHTLHLLLLLMFVE